MKSTRAPRFTIGGVMVGIAVFAFVLAIPSIVRSPDGRAAATLGGWLALLLVLTIVLNILMSVVVGSPCPSCSNWTLRRIARHRRYYRCAHCRARFKHYGFGPWLDASGPEHEAKFRKPSDAGNWTGFEVPKILEGSTTGELLKDKRSGEWRDHEPRPPRITDPGPRMHEAEQRVRKYLTRIHAPDDQHEDD